MQNKAWSSVHPLLATDSPSRRNHGGETPFPAMETSRVNLAREHTYRLGAVLLTGDWVIACLAIFTGLELREIHRLGWAAALHPPNESHSLLILSALGAGSVFAWLMAMLRTYEGANLYRTQCWMRNMVYAALTCATLAWACVGLFQVVIFSPRIGALYSVAVLLVAFTTWRMFAFMFLMRADIREAVSTRIIVVGWNEKVAALRTAMRHDLGQLSEIVGCVPIPGGRLATKPPAELAVLGDYGALAHLVAECHADSILLADLSFPAGEIHHLIAFCQRQMLGFRMVPVYFPALTTGLQVEIVSGVALLSVSQLPLDRALNRALKRGVDLLGGTIGLLLAAVLVPIFGAIVYVQSPGPVIFPQVRTSRNGRTFVMYKIRSMKINAEGAAGAVWAKQDDPRRLKIGTFMRKYNIDEIPQFWNVLKGDMSLVGPRPERPELIAKFKDHVPNYNARHEVHAGMTGWAQINGFRGDSDLGKRIEADLHYLENWSLMLDFYCIIATFFRNKNAG